ncbi:MAG: (2Fe-2S)-binding protein [Rhodospirillaceae bacterium]|nr:(2Fe-2S)-binding protein [Rhodospirillaceae bacterium]
MEDMLEDTVLVNLRINGKLHELEIPAHKSLLDLLRDDLNMTGTHMGCMTGHCGACTVSIDGRVAKSCITLAATLGRAKITTIEGLTQDDGELSPVQQAFWDEAGFQCAFCAPGMLMCTTELLDANPDPSDAEIETALAGNLCRCTGYQSLRRAVKAAAKLKQNTREAAE